MIWCILFCSCFLAGPAYAGRFTLPIAIAIAESEQAAQSRPPIKPTVPAAVVEKPILWIYGTPTCVACRRFAIDAASGEFSAFLTTNYQVKHAPPPAGMRTIPQFRVNGEGYIGYRNSTHFRQWLQSHKTKR